MCDSALRRIIWSSTATTLRRSSSTEKAPPKGTSFAVSHGLTYSILASHALTIITGMSSTHLSCAAPYSIRHQPRFRQLLKSHMASSPRSWCLVGGTRTHIIVQRSMYLCIRGEARSEKGWGGRPGRDNQWIESCDARGDRVDRQLEIQD
jgi:hypothetical protein